MRTIAFFNNKGGVGKTSLVYHLAWMFAEQGVPVLAVDLDPQANLTAMFLAEQRLEALWAEGESRESIFGAIRPILKGVGDVNSPFLETVTPNLSLIPGDLGLSRFEDKLSSAWPLCQNRDEAAFRTMTAFHRLIEMGAARAGAKLVLIDVGPNLGAINRAALIASDQVCLPLAPDLFSLQGLRNLGPTLRDWRDIWTELKPKAPKDISLPSGAMEPMGYVVMQHSVKDSRPVVAYQRWMKQIPKVYRETMLNQFHVPLPEPEQDPYKLALLKHYRSLMPLAMAARKPMFFLKPADGAIGSHVEAVKKCFSDFFDLAQRVGMQAEIRFAGSLSD